MRADAVLSALIARWTAYTLKRAIADVAATSDQAFRDFGLDRGEVLRALGRLRSDIEARSGAAPRVRRSTRTLHGVRRGQSRRIQGSDLQMPWFSSHGSCVSSMNADFRFQIRANSNIS